MFKGIFIWNTIYALLTKYFVGGAVTFLFVPNTTITNTEVGTQFWDCINGPRLKDNELEPIAVYLDSKWKVAEQITLVKDTEIIFGDNSAIYGADADAMQCLDIAPDVTVKYYWHDVNNWVADKDNVTKFLHAQMLPSDHEVAYFRPNSAYYVTINIPFRIGGIYINDQPFSTDMFISHMMTAEGRYQFKYGLEIAEEDAFNPSALFTDPVEITNFECRNITGCENSNLGKRVMKEICSYITCSTKSVCQTKLQPKGHCCSLCGTLINFKINSNFVMARLEGLQNYVLSKYSKILMSIMKTTPSTVQVVLTPTDSSVFETSVLDSAVSDVMNGIKYDLPGIQKDTISVTLSETLSAYDTVSLVLTLLCVICFLIGLVFVVKKKRTTVLNWITSGRVSLRAVWRRRQDDEMTVELTEPSSSYHSDAATGGGSYKDLLEKEKFEVPQPQWTKRKEDKGLTYANPIFETKYD